MSSPLRQQRAALLQDSARTWLWPSSPTICLSTTLTDWPWSLAIRSAEPNTHAHTFLAHCPVFSFPRVASFQCRWLTRRAKCAWWIWRAPLFHSRCMCMEGTCWGRQSSPSSLQSPPGCLSHQVLRPPLHQSLYRDDGFSFNADIQVAVFFLLCHLSGPFSILQKWRLRRSRSLFWWPCRPATAQGSSHLPCVGCRWAASTPPLPVRRYDDVIKQAVFTKED